MNLWKTCLDLLFPPKCPFCRCILESGGQGLCPKCQRTLPWLVGPSGERHIPGADGCWSPLEYKGLVVEAVRRYKFSGLRCYHTVFGHLMAQCVTDHLRETVDLVTWAPLSRKRLRERGYDQAKLLAEQVSRELSVPLAPTLRKVRNTLPQSEREDEAQRRANVAGAYALRPGTELTGKRLLLVDDVVTSGATLEECIVPLRRAGAKRVWCLTLAQAGKDGKRKN